MTAAPPLARLAADRWDGEGYDRDALPERVLQFGTGMLLRALPVALVDAANRAGRFGGRVVIVQSTPNGLAADFAAQDGLFTLVERGAERGAPVERTRLVGSVSRALVASTQWDAVRDVAASPALRVIVSNVTEAGFRLDDADVGMMPGGAAPASYPAKLADLLHARFRRTPDAPTLLVVPTELVDDNGPRLRAMVERVAAEWPDGAAFREWLASRVRFCSSLVDRITTGTPEPVLHRELEARVGYADGLLTVAEPYALWAVEGDVAELRDAFAIDGAEGVDGAEPPVIFAPDIRRYRERKIRLLNGTHTAAAPLARLAGVPTVREAMAHDALAPFVRQVLFSEIASSVDLPAAELRAFASAVIDRFANPWLDHAWSVIATNQTAKMRLRVVPSIAALADAGAPVPRGLALAVAAYLRHARSAPGAAGEGTGWWRGESYRVVDADLAAVARHWHAAEGDAPTGPVDPATLDAVADAALADEALWGRRLADWPEFSEAVRAALRALEADGAAAAAAAAASAADAPS